MLRNRPPICVERKSVSDAPTVTMYSPDGAPVQVDAEQAPELYRQQKLGFAEGQKVNLTRGGKVFELTPDKLDAAFDNGYQIANDEQVAHAKENKEFSGIGKTAEAFGLGAVRGLTFGLSDPAIVGAAGAIGGDESREATRRELKLSKEHHNVASIAGEVTGALAPIIASGGTAAAGEGAVAAGAEAAAPSLLRRAISTAGFIPRGAAAAGELAEHAATAVVGGGAESVLARVAQKAFITGAQAGTEGALFGAGSAVSEATLGNEELNAEKILAGAAHGFKLGALSGAALGGGLELGKAAIDKGLKIVGKEGLESYLNDIANEQTLKAAGISKRDYRNLGKTPESIQEHAANIAEEIRGYRFEDGKKLFTGTSSQSQLAEGLQEAVDEVGNKLGKFREKTFKLAGDNNISADAEGFFQKFDSQILKPAVEQGGVLETRALKAAKEMENLRARAVPPGLTEEHPLYQVWKSAEEGNIASKNAMDIAVTKDPKLAELVTPRPISLEDMTNLRKQFDQILYPKRVNGIAPPPPEHLSEIASARQLLEQHIEQATDRVVEQTGNSQVMGAYKTLKQQYRNLADANSITSNAEIGRLSRNNVPLSDKMAAGSVLAGMLAHGNPASLAYAGVAGVANHFANKFGNATIANMADKASQLIALQNHVHSADTHVAEGINAFLGEMHETEMLAHKLGHIGREVAKTGLEAKEHSAVEQAQHLVSDPEAMATHVAAISGAIAEHAPKTALAVQDKAVQVAQNIANQAPQGHQIEDVVIPAAKPKASDAEKHRSTIYASVATKGPTVAVKAMKEGTLTPVHVQSWKENYPNWYAETKQSVLQGIVDRSGKIDYEKRKQLGIFLEAPIDATQTPQFKQSMQSVYAQSQPQQQSGGGGSKRPSKSLAANQLTPSQKLNSE